MTTKIWHSTSLSLRHSLSRHGPEALIAFLEAADDYEDAVRNAISLGGDSDTLACITGGIAEAFYGLPADQVVAAVQTRRSRDLWQIVERFYDECASTHIDLHAVLRRIE